MPTIVIGDKRVNVDESFLSLTPEQQEQEVEDIALSLGIGESQQSKDLRAELSAMTQNPARGAYEALPEWQKPMVAASDLGQLAASGATFGFLDKAAAAVRAPFTGQTYEDELAQQRAKTKAARDRSGWAGTVAEVGGGVGTGLGLVRNGLTTAGRLGTSTMTGLPGFAARSGLSGLEGAGYGLASSLGYDTDPKAGILYGGALGAAAPTISSLVGSGLGGLTRWASGTRGSTPAQRMFATNATSDAIDDVAGAVKRIGPDAMPMDAGPNLKSLGEAVVTVPGSGRTVIEKAVRARDAGANARLTGALDDTLGKAPVPSQVEQTIRQGMDALGPAYDDVFRGAQPVDTKPIAKQLDSMSQRLRGGGQKAAQSIRKMLNVAGKETLDNNPRTLFEIRRAIDGMFDTADSSAKNTLTVIRQQIDKELARAVPGIKSVDAQFAELSRQAKALERGQQMLDSGRTAPRPSEVADEFRSGATPEGQLIGPSGASSRLRQGARAEIERIVGTNANDRVALQRLIKGEGDWNRDRLATLFGKDKADRIFSVLDREAKYADTSNAVFGNSRTARRTEAVSALRNDRRPGVLHEAMNADFGNVAKRMGDTLFNGMDDVARDASLKELGELLTGPAGASPKIRAIQAAQKRGDITKEAATKMIRIFGVTGAGGQIPASGQEQQRLEITVGRPRQ